MHRWRLTGMLFICSSALSRTCLSNTLISLTKLSTGICREGEKRGKEEGEEEGRKW